jgi:hypothetical protein
MIRMPMSKATAINKLIFNPKKGSTSNPTNGRIQIQIARARATSSK